MSGFDDLGNDPSFKAALGTYETVCQLRHACVHARGELGTANVKALGLQPMVGRRRVTLGLNELHQAAKACIDVTPALNKLLFRRIVERWIDNAVLKGKWASDKGTYSPLYGLFRGSQDSVGPATAYHSYQALIPTLRKRLTPLAEK